MHVKSITILAVLLCLGVHGTAHAQQQIKINNTYNDDNRAIHWKVFVDETSTVLQQIKCVRYLIYPTLPNPVRNICDSSDRFAIRGDGRGEFSIEARVEWSNGKISFQSYMLDLHSADHRDDNPVEPLYEATFVLQSGEYTHVGPGQPVDCPRCKDLFYATEPLSAPSGKVITSVQVISRSPAGNNHWYRCGKEANCGGLAEFSDVSDHSRSCIGTPACVVWRASDGRTGNETDTIKITWQ